MLLTDYMRQRLEVAGWQIISQNDIDLFMRTSISPNQAKKVWVLHIVQPIDPEQIRRCFEFDGHVLFVVAENLVPDIKDRDSTPLWLRTLHGLYMGRVYVWNGKGINGLHFDYDGGGILESGYITVDDLDLQETNTWLKGWPGTYRTAFLGEPVWWMGQKKREQKPPPREDKSWEDLKQKIWEEINKQQQQDFVNGRKPPPEGSNSQSERQAYESARDAYWNKQRERTGTAPGGKAFWEDDLKGSKPPPHTGQAGSGNWYWANWGDKSQEYAYEPPKPSEPPRVKQDAPPKRDLFAEFMACDSLADARRMWKKLLLDNHPDKFAGQPDKVAAQTALTQEINAAYQKAERYLK